MTPVVRVSILTIPDGHIEDAAESMRKAEEELKGVQKLKGLRAYFAGVDRARSQLTNVSVWDSAENAEQMSSFQPMLDLGKRFANGRFVEFQGPMASGRSWADSTHSGRWTPDRPESTLQRRCGRPLAAAQERCSGR